MGRFSNPIDNRPGLFGDAVPTDHTGHGGLLRRWGFPPFTVLNAQLGPWQARKQEWKALGIKSELGRDATAISFGPEARYGRPEGSVARSGTSIFDPVLCELVYRWFCPPSGRILDPFAGGSVRGMVAALMGYDYTGIELRQEQIDSNRAQVPAILSEAEAGRVRWVQGDSLATLRDPDNHAQYDFIFSCPPYYDLEVYSDDPADLSNAPSYEVFRDSMAEIIGHALAHLTPNRFACFVVGDIRDDQGFMRNLPGDTVAAFERHGARLYNSVILAIQLTTLPMRTSHNFPVSRKMGMAHQHVFIFCKGSPREASSILDPGDDT